MLGSLLAAALIVSPSAAEPSDWAVPVIGALELVTVIDGDPPGFPDAYRGYVADGDPVRHQVRIFGPTAVSSTGIGGMMRCGESYWAARWRSTAQDVAVTAAAAYDFKHVSSDLAPHPAGSAGLVVGLQCAELVFYVVSGEPNELIDVIVDVQTYTQSIDLGEGPPMPEEPPSLPPFDVAPPRPASEISCTNYAVIVDLPYWPCSQSLHVSFIQQRLAELGFPVDNDGYYGPATYAAVVAYQQSIGLVADGVVGPTTWYTMMDGADWLREWDVTGRGSINPADLGYGE